MTINEIYSYKVAKDVADKKPVAEIIATTKRLIQIHFCSRYNKNQISESGLNNACSKLDAWSKLPSEKALSKIQVQIDTSQKALKRIQENAKKRYKEEARRMMLEATNGKTAG